MKKTIWITLLISICLISCRKEELGWKLPRVRAFVTTEFSTDIQSSRITAKGKVEEGNAGPIKERGFCWSTQDNPDLSQNRIIAVLGTGEYKAEITGLQPDTEYYVRAYAINEHGTWYGEVVKQSTFFGIWPKVKTLSAIQESPMKIRVYGEITDDGGYPNSTRNFCFSQSSIPDSNDQKIYCGTGSGIYDTLITLSTQGDWYFRTYSSNQEGVTYGEILKVTASQSIGPTVPQVLTDTAPNVYSSSISVKGSIVFDGGSPISATGFCYSTSPNPDILTGQVETNLNVFFNFSSLLINLAPSTTYYIKAFGTNAVGTGYGNEIIVTTAP